MECMEVSPPGVAFLGTCGTGEGAEAVAGAVCFGLGSGSGAGRDAWRSVGGYILLASIVQQI